MIAKKNRLTERQVKKVLQKWKPFFTQWYVLNSCMNREETHRFSIVIWWKSVQNAVERNFFRRMFYEIVRNDFLEQQIWKSYDITLLVKKVTKLERNNKKSVANFQNDIHFLLRKLFKHSSQ